MSISPRRTRPLSVALVLTLLAALLAFGATATPASSHVTGSVKHLWSKHIKPKADKRYYTKKASNKRFLTPAQADARYQSATTGFGDSLSGVWSAAAPTGSFGVAVIPFDPPLPAGVTGNWLNVGQTSIACPGAGQATPGNLCVYTSFNNSMTLQGIGFHNPTTGGTGVVPAGTILYMNSASALGNARGNWTVTAPLSAARPLPKQKLSSPSASTD